MAAARGSRIERAQLMNDGCSGGLLLGPEARVPMQVSGADENKLSRKAPLATVP